MKKNNHSLFLKTEWNHKIAAGTFSAGFKCTFQLYECHSPSVSPHIWSFICMTTHCRVLSVSPLLYLMSTLSICTPLDSLCPYHSFIVGSPSTQQERHLWLLSHGRLLPWATSILHLSRHHWVHSLCHASSHKAASALATSPKRGVETRTGNLTSLLTLRNDDYMI